VDFECIQLTKIYTSHNGTISALENVSFQVGDQEFVCIVGPSGCGKTTLLKIIAGLIKPTSGEIMFDESPHNKHPKSALVFQEQGIFPWMSVLDNVAFGLEMQRVAKQKRHQLAHEFIQRVGLNGFANNYPHELSGGMRQRVALARAFLADPQILLMDEPFGALDAQTRLVLQEELLRIWRDEKKMVIFVTHDIEEAVMLSDKVLIMSGRPGRILEEIPIPINRPRNLQAIDQPEVTEIKWHIWEMLKDEVLKELKRTG
jgi:NitT/TauT family transport system ATP-binding protein